MQQGRPRTQHQSRDTIPWDNLKETIENLYLRREFTNKMIVEYLLNMENGLSITQNQLEYQLKKWKIRKNMKKEDYIYTQIAINKSDHGGSAAARRAAHKVYLSGVPQSDRKLRKGLWRHKAQEAAKNTG
ncbi:hypothetical protein TWF730_003167 [Orbilia blumenaviensis]|uniref:Clr5 domain-containing protein n=1 Tax=Orbilia blumenaviensis TaxID=1796055 RepID=A0AAV9U4U2_9PEZI